MIGFVSAISSALAVIILITITSLLGYVNSFLPKTGLQKINDYHYNYIMGGMFVGQERLNSLTLKVAELEAANNMVLATSRPVCNFGFNRPEREMNEVATFNFIKTKQYYRGEVNVLNIRTEEYNGGFNYCYLDIRFSKNS
jgi:hypothetical protein